MERTEGCDAELHAAWQAGDSRAAAQLIVRHRPALRRLGEQLGLSAMDAEDLAQQTLLEAHRSRYEARPGVPYFHWLSTIARRQAMRIVARRARSGELPVRQPTSPWTGTWRGRLVARIDEMPEHLGEVFARLAAGYTQAEISQELGIHPSTLRMRILRGRQWLLAHGR